MPVMVYRFGLRREGGRLREGGPDGQSGRDSTRWAVAAELTEQLEKVHAYRQDLIRVEHEDDEARKRLWSSVPEIAAIEEQIAAADEAVREMMQAVREDHSRTRSSVTSAETEARIRTAQSAVRQLRQQRRELIAAAAPGMQEELAALKLARTTALTECRQQHAAGGLYWGSYNAASAAHQVAVQLVDNRRRKNLPAQLRHSYFKGTGTIAVQLQRESGGVSPAERLLIAEMTAAGMRPASIAARLAEQGFEHRSARTIALIVKSIAAGKPAARQKPADPPRSPELMASGEGKWRNVFQIRPWMPPEEFDVLPRSERRRIARTGELILAVGGGRTITVPVTVHRMLPAEGEVTAASLTVTRTAGQWDISVSVTVLVPEPEPVASGPSVAVHCGWRKRPDGSVRVGVWASAVPLEVPAHLTGVLEPGKSGRAGEIVIPASWLDRAGYSAAIQGIRDTNLEPVRGKLASWLDEHPQEDLTGPDVRRWRSPGRFAALALRWRTSPPPDEGGAEISALLEEWRKRDRHIWEIGAHDHEQLIGRRNDAFRKIAAWVISRAGILVVDDMDLAALRRRSDSADSDPVLPGIAQQKSRARASLAAPGRLRLSIIQAAGRRGVAVKEVRSAFLSRTCPRCGVIGEADPRYAASAKVACQGCGWSYDQDFSAASIMLNRASASDEEQA